MSFMPYEPYLKEPARILRKSMTPQEKKLWYEFLRKQSPRFLRQKPLGKFVADFYCSACKLVIEVDGSQHYEKDQMLSDAERTAYLSSMGITVLRFSNFSVDHEFQSVCQAVINAVKTTSSTTDHPNSTEESL